MVGVVTAFAVGLAVFFALAKLLGGDVPPEDELLPMATITAVAVALGFAAAAPLLAWAPGESRWLRWLAFPALVSALGATAVFAPPGSLIGWCLAFSLAPSHGGASAWILGALVFTFALALCLRAGDRRLRRQEKSLDAGQRFRRRAFGLGVWIALAIIASNAALGPTAYGGSHADGFQVGIGWVSRAFMLYLPLGTLVGAWIARRARLGGDRRRWGRVLAGIAIAVVGLDVAVVLWSLAA